jgi:hypothetical protein
MNNDLRDKISEAFTEIDETVLLMDGFDEALIGFSERMNNPTLAVYSWEKMMAVCIDRDGMTSEQAEEYISFNCLGAWVGEGTPIIVLPLEF